MIMWCRNASNTGCKWKNYKVTGKERVNHQYDCHGYTLYRSNWGTPVTSFMPILYQRWATSNVLYSCPSNTTFNIKPHRLHKTKRVKLLCLYSWVQTTRARTQAWVVACSYVDGTMSPDTSRSSHTSHGLVRLWLLSVHQRDAHNPLHW